MIKVFEIPLQKKFNFGMAKNGPRLRYRALLLGINSTNHFFFAVMHAEKKGKKGRKIAYFSFIYSTTRTLTFYTRYF